MASLESYPSFIIGIQDLYFTSVITGRLPKSLGAQVKVSQKGYIQYSTATETYKQLRNFDQYK